MKQRLHRLLRNVPKPPTNAMKKQVEMILADKDPTGPYLLGNEWVVEYTSRIEYLWVFDTIPYNHRVRDTVEAILSYDTKQEPISTSLRTYLWTPPGREIGEKDYNYSFKRYMV
jgi:hypothetical protein